MSAAMADVTRRLLWMRVVVEFLAECIRQPREAAHRHPLSEALTLGVGRVDVLGSGLPSTRSLCAPVHSAGL